MAQNPHSALIADEVGLGKTIKNRVSPALPAAVQENQTGTHPRSSQRSTAVAGRTAREIQPALLELHSR